MFFSILIGLAFWFCLASTPLVFIPYWIMKFLGFKTQAWTYFFKLAQFVSRFLMRISRVKFVILGLENIAKDHRICIVANHQSYVDIMTCYMVFPFLPGFIAKRELGKIPLLRTWMVESGCYFMKRDSLKDGLAAILHGVDRIKRGFPMVIFPEGRRSMGRSMGKFHKGSLKLATKAKSWLLPVSFHGTATLLEAHGRVTPTTIGVKIHPPIDTSKLTHEEEDQLSDQVHKIIAQGVEDLKNITQTNKGNFLKIIP